MTSSAATITTRRQRPARIQSSATVTACVVAAQAALTCVFGPRAPMISANWEWPIASTRNKNLRSNSNGSRSSESRSSRDPTVDVRGGGIVVAHRGAHLGEGGELLAVVAVGPEAFEVVRERVETRERGGEHDSRVVSQLVGQHPPIGELGADASRLVVLDERNAGVAQRVEPGPDRELGHDVERGGPVGLDTELVHDVERAGAARELDDVVRALDGLEHRVGVGPLDQAGDVLVEDLGLQGRRDCGDELLTAQDAGDRGLVEHAGGPGHAERGARDHDRLVDGRFRGRDTGACREDGPAAFYEVVEEVANIRERVVRCLGRRRLLFGSNGDGLRGGHILGGRAEPGGVAAAERLVERDDVTLLRMVGEQREDVVVVAAEDVLGEAVERLLRTNLHEDAGAGVVQGAQALHELYR